MDNYVYEPQGAARAPGQQNAAFFQHAAQEARQARRIRENVPVKANLKSLSALRRVSKRGVGEELALPPNVERRIIGFVSELGPGRRGLTNNVARQELGAIKSRREAKLRELAEASRAKYENAVREEELRSENALDDEAPADAIIPNVIPVAPRRIHNVEKSRKRRGKAANVSKRYPKAYAGNKTKKRTNRSRSRSKSKSKGSK
jgi:hypothetical protein